MDSRALVANSLSFVQHLIKEHEDISEVMLNPDGAVWIEVAGVVFLRPELSIAPEQAWSMVRTLAGHHDMIVNLDNPMLNCKLPVFHGGRFMGLIPPVTTAPSFSIRFLPKKVWSLEDLYRFGMIDTVQLERLEKAVSNHETILIAGGTSSGKTTVANAVIDLIQTDRVLLVEDNPEIRLRTKNCFPMLTQKNFSLRDALEATLRLRPDRIIVGEVRTGDVAVSMCSAWLTGHRGGIGTIHADSAEGVLRRLYSLQQQVILTPSIDDIKASIDLIVYVQKIEIDGKATRRVTKIIETREMRK